MCASLALIGVFVVAAESTQTAVANGDTRTLSFYHTHSQERITVTFKKDGKYDQSGLRKLNHFLRDWRNQKEIDMEPRLFDVVWEVQKDAGSNAPIQIISAFRSPETNEKLRSRSKGVAKHSQHTLGRAMDIHLPDVNMSKIREAGLRLQRGGVGFYPTSAKPFVHLDVGSVRHWPRMTRDQLVRLFPDGRTVHLPTDGVPLKNYQLAMNDVIKNGGVVRGMNESQIAQAQRNQDKSSGPYRGGLLAKLLGGDDDDDDVPPTAPATAVAPEAPVALAAIEAAVPMPEQRPMEMNSGGPQLASAYAPQQLPAGPEMIWRSGPDGVGRAATSTTPGYATDTTPNALPQQRQVIDTNAAPVTASLGIRGNLSDQREEAMRLLGMMREPPPVQAEADINNNEPSARIAAAFDNFAPAPEQHTASVQHAAPAVAYAPRRAARDRDLALSHPNFEHEGLISAPVRVLPSTFGGNPNGNMRSDMFSGSPVPVLRTVYFGPQRTALLAQ